MATSFNGQIFAFATSWPYGISGTVAAWNGTAWLGAGAGLSGTVNAFVVHGNQLFAGGSLSLLSGLTSCASLVVGGFACSNVAVWNGTLWRNLDGFSAAMNGAVYALASIKGVLYAGGSFTFAGMSTAANLAQYDGTTWTGLGGGVNGLVYALASTNNQSALAVGGSFTS